MSCARAVFDGIIEAAWLTGTIGIIAGTTLSIEPLFALAYRHTHVLGAQTLPEINPIFREALGRCGMQPEPLIVEVASKGHLMDLKEIPADLKRLFVTALEIPPWRHIQIQAAFQRHVDNSVSKTVNLPQEATVKDVAGVY